MPATRPHVLVIGSGLAGLAAAESLVRGRTSGDLEVTVVDPSGRVGGVLGTVLDAGWLVERSADCFLAARPEAISLVERIGLGDQVIGVEPPARRALVWHAGRCRPVPAGFRLLAPGRVRPILTTPLLSLRGRGRLLWERFVPRARGTSDDESLEQFAVRRLGREAFERLVQPLAAGIWTADPARLSMAAACPEFLAMERDAGSLWAGERIRQRGTVGADHATGARYGQFVTLRSGMEALPQRLAERLRAAGVRFVTGRVSAVSRDAERRWRVAGSGLDAAAVGNVDALVVATPAHVAAEMLGSLDPPLADELASIDYAGSCIVSLGYARDHVGHPLDAAGLVIPRIAGRGILAVSFSSSKFPGRAPAGCVLLRVFLGGALDPGAMQLADGMLVERARAEVADLLAARGEPRLVHVERWARAMPQYHLGHASRVARIDAALARHPGLALAGAAYTGVGIPQVIASGQAAAETCRRCLS
ncbi:MAG: protoporphyrinogen oxidase [Planctomycetaceae bacterium]